MKYPKKHGVCVDRRKAYVRNASKMATRTAYDYYMYSPMCELETEYLDAVEKVTYLQSKTSMMFEEWQYHYVEREDYERVKSELEAEEKEMQSLATALRNYR